jgi:Mrr N-terminal domain
MPTITVAQETLDALAALAEPFVDTTAESVIRRLLAAYERSTDNGQPVEALNARRAKPGEFVRHQDFKEPLLDVLREAGGELRAQEAIDRVGERLAARLSKTDRTTLESGEIRWRNNVRWARDRLVKEGKLDRNARHGYWRLNNNAFAR